LKVLKNPFEIVCLFKLNWGFAKCNFQNLDKKYSAYGVRTERLLFLPSKKAKMNFTQSMGFAEGLYAIAITLHIAQLCLPLS